MIITGSEGFIGGHLKLKRPDAFVWDRKIASNPRLEYLENKNLDRTIIHLAASTYLTEGYDRQMIEDNITLLSKIDDCCSRLIYASSAAVYKLNNLYAYSKRYAEDYFSKRDATGLRFYNVYGPGDNGVVSKIINCCLTGDLFHLYGGDQRRDFIFIDDVVREILAAVHSREKIIEVGTGRSTSIYEIIRMVEVLVGKKLNYQQHPFNSYESAESICTKPLKQSLALEQGLIQTVNFYTWGK